MLSQRFRCILHDFRGQLRGERPPAPFDMYLHVDDLIALLDRLGIDSAHVAGTSYRGEVGDALRGGASDRLKRLAVIAIVANRELELREVAGLCAKSAPEKLWDVTLPYNYSRGCEWSTRSPISATRSIASTSLERIHS